MTTVFLCFCAVLLVLLLCWIYSAVMNFVEAAKNRDDQRALEHNQLIALVRALGERIYQVEIDQKEKMEKLNASLAALTLAVNTLISQYNTPHPTDQQLEQIAGSLDTLTGSINASLNPTPVTPAA